jgi:malonate-semialdehyde dehydrogenase (acetylating)/methylmalonate-semialdehyde dehydrogenase
LTASKPAHGCDKGFWMGGTLFDHVTPEMRIYKEEIFGPRAGAACACADFAPGGGT